MPDAHLRVFRGTAGEQGRFDDFDVPVEEGMVVLDALHWIQGHGAPDLAVRWNCKAAKCGSCSAEVDGRPRLTCKTRLSDFDLEEPITVEPMRAFPDQGPRHRRVVELRGQQDDPAVHAPGGCPAGRLALAAGGHQPGPGIPQVHRVFPVPGRLPRPAQSRDRQALHGPALPRSGGGSEMHPVDQADRREYLKDSGGIGYCNITKCCTEVCPEHIKITDNAIILLKERVADEYYDPLRWAWRRLRGRDEEAGTRSSCPSCRATRRRPTRPPNDRPDVPGAGAAVRGTGLCRIAVRRSDAGRWPAVGVPHPDRRRRPRQPRSRVGWGGPVRPSPRRRPRPAGGADASISDYLGIQTNNVAEYTGTVRALELARELGASEVHLLLDSKLIVEQLAGRWRVKDAKLIPLWAEARQTLAGFTRWTAAHVPRAQNSVADALANEAIDRADAGGPASVVRRPT